MGRVQSPIAIGGDKIPVTVEFPNLEYITRNIFPKDLVLSINSLCREGLPIGCVNVLKDLLSAVFDGDRGIGSCLGVVFVGCVFDEFSISGRFDI